MDDIGAVPMDEQDVYNALEGQPYGDVMSMSDEELMSQLGMQPTTAAQQEDFSSLSDEELMAELGQPQQKPEQANFLDKVGAYGRAALTKPFMGGSFADELLAIPATAGTTAYRAVTGQSIDPVGDYGKNLQNIEDSFNKDREIAPVATFAGDVAGDINMGMGAAKLAGRAAPSAVAKVAKYARAKPLIAASGIGGISGGIYGAGASDGSLRERGEAGAAGGLVGVGLGPAGAFVGAKGGALLSRAKALLRPETKALTQQVQQIPQTYGEKIPMTRGQSLQNLKTQALEIGARKGSYGEEAQSLMQRADSAQQAGIRSAVGDIGSGSESDLVKAGQQVKQAYKSQKAKVSSAYDDVDTIGRVFVNKTPISETYVPAFNKTLQKYNLDRADLSEEGKRVFDIINSKGMKDPQVTAVNLQRMEKWRGKASNVMANNNAVKGNAAEGAAMREAVEQYDRFMAKLPEDALKSGDEEALDAILKARGERRKQGLLFERDKVVKNIVQSQDLTSEELANLVLTGSARAESLNASSGRVVRNLKRAVGDKAPELQNDLKSGLLARMLRRSTSTTLESGTDVRTIDPAKLRKEFDALVKNRTFLKEIFSPEDIDLVDKIHGDLVKISSVQPGADNYSNTAYALMRFVNIVPTGRAVIGDALRGLGDKVATKDLEKGLSPILGKMMDDLTAQRRFYGATAGGAAGGEMTITVTPQDK